MKAQAVLQGSVSAAAARSLESGAVFERWIKTGQWLNARQQLSEDGAPALTGNGVLELGADDALVIIPPEMSGASNLCVHHFPSDNRPPIILRTILPKST